MKKTLIILFPIVLFFTACGGDSVVDKPTNASQGELPEGMAALDLSKHGIPLIINIPDSVSVKAKLQVEPQPTGAILIKMGNNYQLSIQEADGELIDMTLQKSFIQSDDVNKLQKFIVDESGAVFYESRITEPEFHFYVIRKIENISYVIRDNPEEKFSKEAAQKMFDAAKSLRIKEGAKS